MAPNVSSSPGRAGPEPAPLPLLVDGAARPAAATETAPVLEPATGRTVARVPLCGPADVDAAVRAAAAAFPGWRTIPVPDRVQVLFRYKALLEREQDSLAASVSRENGKLLPDARAEVRRGIEVVDFACGMPTLAQGRTVEGIARGMDSHTWRVPVGVVAGICPFNFPAMIPLWMFPIAVAAGNTFVLKPSERTPSTGLRLAELFQEAGLPPGVMNVVHGGRDAVDALLDHPLVRAVSFVGSEGVARHVYARAAASGKRVQAMAGAKNHLLVLPDADLDLTVSAVMGSAFGAAGQRCLAGSVLVPVGGAAEPLLERLASEARATRVGDPFASDSAMGPVIREDSRARVRRYIEAGLAEGAALVVDGREATAGGNGFFIGPTILDRVAADSTLARDEIFGPLLATVRAGSVEEAVALANRSRYGNAASIFTTSGKAAAYFRRNVEAGMIGVNVGVAAPMAFFPFAGWKSSFFGDLHATGEDAVRFYTETRVVMERWA
ncbi:MULTISPECIES: CoA-acylating methylmalonate-semialdehyde dehydrogenase [Anaeromyxobacter]|uniref:CoA-acylating methylmalonate-semialdehyde dehydrogenase n=1 Tax=Anaeromyxobacter TaxID=161492 RepID=UPI001F586B5C|nr:MULTISPECIES: CoA-acylating methylmalonate-semialdehyde dehydrogenase [unclassified Anaeromyxobacter]